MKAITSRALQMSQLRYQCWTKATDKERGQPRRSSAWLASRRAWFKVFEDRIECGNWTISVSDIQEAVLFESTQFFIPVLVLQLSTAENTYQFGFNPWSKAIRFLPFEVQRRRVKLHYSVFSILKYNADGSSFITQCLASPYVLRSLYSQFTGYGNSLDSLSC